MSSASVDPTVSPPRERGLRGFIAKRLAKRGKSHQHGPGARPGLQRDSVDPVVRASRLAKAKSRRFAREVRSFPLTVHQPFKLPTGPTSASECSSMTSLAGDSPFPARPDGPRPVS